MNEPMEDPMAQCRACLCKLKKNLMSKDIFKIYLFCDEDWKQSTIAAEMAKVANVEIADLKGYPRHVCHKCLNRLKSAIPLIRDIKKSQEILRANVCNVEDDSSGKIWPKPIQLDRSLSEDILRDSTDVEVKQEVISDDECRDDDVEMEDEQIQDNSSAIDIKLEPEEMVEQPEIQVTVNGTISEALHDRIATMTNGFELFENEEYLESNSDPVIKQEPLSEDESASDLPMDCILCTKQFNTLSGLRAHVLALHNYKTVKRKAAGSTSPGKKQGSSTGKTAVKYVCNICKRNFSTSTDLKVHEVCHDKFTCFACDAKFETFKAVTQHRRWCKAKNTVARPPKTLTDILNERKAQMKAAAAKLGNEQHWECWDCLLSFRDIFNYKVHNSKHHPNTLNSKNSNDATNSKDKPKELVEIEINIKQEVKDEKHIKIKEEKAEVDYKKIETELESMFDNPCESDKSCANVTVDSVNVSEQVKECNSKSDQGTLEKELCNVNKENDKNDQLKTGEAFKQDSEQENKLANTFNDLNTNLTELSVDNESNMITNNQDVLKEHSQENNSLNNEEVSQAQASETKQVEDEPMEIDATVFNNKDTDTTENNNKDADASDKNKNTDTSDKNKDTDAADKNNKDTEVTENINKDTGASDKNNKETDEPDNNNKNTDASDRNKETDALSDASDINNKDTDASDINNKDTDTSDKNKDTDASDKNKDTDESDKNKDTDASDKNKDTDASDKNKDTDASDNNKDTDASDNNKDTDASDNNNKDENTELDRIADNCESATDNNGDSKVNEKAELVE